MILSLPCSQQTCGGHGFYKSLLCSSLRSWQAGQIRHTDLVAPQLGHILGSDREAGGIHRQSDRIQFELSFQTACQITGSVLVVNIRDEFRHEVGCGADTSHSTMAQAGVQKGILAAKDLEIHIAGAADELCCLGDIAAGVLHAYDIGNIVCQLVHELCAQRIADTTGIIIQQNRRFGNTFCDGLEVLVQLGIRYRTKMMVIIGPYGVPQVITYQEPYEYYICTVKLKNKDLSHLPVEVLTEEQLSAYSLYMRTLGNRPDLFGHTQYPNASTIKQPTYYDIPPEALKDDRFAAMMEEATKYIGYPYVWGGSSPSTSFDCSGYISWVLNHSGWNVGRQTAQGLYNLCTPVSAAQVKPGDLVFFKGTYDTPGVSHCGIYVGNSIMLHCGDPISYTNLNSKYWQEHFYSYGRLP